MDLLPAGPPVLFAIGALALIEAIWMTVRKSPATLSFMPLICGLNCGFALVGVEMWGPLFLAPYADFMKSLSDMQKHPGGETCGNCFADVGSGKYPEEFGRIGTAFAINNRVEGLDSLLDESAEHTHDSSGAMLLRESRRIVIVNTEIASNYFQEIRKNNPTQPMTALLDSSKGWQIGKYLAAPDSTLRSLRLNRIGLQTRTQAIIPRRIMQL